MPGLPFAQLGEQSPESMIFDYVDRGTRDIEQRYQVQWDEVNNRASTLGRRTQMEMLNEIQSKATQEMFHSTQNAQSRMKQLKQLDILAKQGGFDASEAKWRMVLSPEAAAAKFPTQKVGQSVVAHTCTIRIKFGGDTIATVVSPGSGDDVPWHINGYATLRSVGGSGSMA